MNNSTTCGAYYVQGQGYGATCDLPPGHGPMHEGEGYGGSRIQWWP